MNLTSELVRQLRWAPHTIFDRRLFAIEGDLPS